MTDSDQRKLILLMSVSFDGFVARKDHVIEWLSRPSGGGVDHGDTRHRATLEALSQIDTILLGRRAYEDMVQAWPVSESPMGVLMNTLPKVVFSQSLSEVNWSGARLSRAPVEDEVPKLKREGGKDLVVFGGARFANSLIRHKLVDEFRLTVHPVALGEGLPLMHGLPEPQRLELVSSAAYADGALTQVFRPATYGAV